MPRLRPRAILNVTDLPIAPSVSAGLAASALNDPNTPAAPASTAGQTNYFGRLITYIPAEVIAVYQAVAGPVGEPPDTHAGDGGVIPAAGVNEVAANTTTVTNSVAANAPAVFHSFLFWFGIFLLILTPIWFYFSTKDKGEPPATQQVVISTLAFFIWLLAVGNPVVELWSGWRPIYGTAAMVLAATIIFPLIEILFRKK